MWQKPIPDPKLLFMKYTSTLLFSLLGYFSASSQYIFTTHYSLASPQQQMGSNIQAAHGLQVGLLRALPGTLRNLQVGLEFGIGMYAHTSVDQTYYFGANNSSVVPVNYKSNVLNASVQTRYNIVTEGTSLVTPYINAKAGVYNFYSNIVVEDPNDPDNCKPLDKDNLINDKTFYWSAGAGVQIHPDVFLKHKRNGRLRIDISANMIRGGKIDYINTRNLDNATEVDEGNGAKPLNIRF